MKAIVVDGDRLRWVDTAAPVIGTGQVRIAVQATAINRADLVQRTGKYPPPPGASDILGLECAGEVIEIGDGVNRVRVGDRVCALLAGGGYAQEVVVPAGQVLPIPKGLDMQQAAAIPEVFATAYLNLYMEAGLEKGERVVLHAGASGVGTAAIQLCRQSGNPCFITAGSDEKISRCVSLGADAGWNRHSGGTFTDAVKAWVGVGAGAGAGSGAGAGAGAGVDVILDPVGAAYFADNVACLGPQGRLVLIGLMGGLNTEINLGALMMKRLKVIGSTLRARPVAAKAAIMDRLLEVVWPDLESGAIRPIIETVMPIEEAERAHALVASDATFGKVVLSVPS